ncbi:MAG: hypothetical protein ACLPVY_07350 [Acidimicrobiia bacterium]
MALMRESERRSGTQISVLAVTCMLETLGAEHWHARKREARLGNA